MSTATQATEPSDPGRREANEAALLAAAASLLDEGAAFTALRVEEIAQRAGLGRTNFYFYFKDKRELLTALAEEAAAALYEQADRWWRGEASTPAELGESVEAVVRLWMRHGRVLGAVVQTAGVDPEVRTVWRGIAGRFVEATRERIDRERQAGRTAAEPSAETAFALVWMTERACYQHVQDGGHDTSALVAALTGVWQRSVYGALPA
jgi:AcrR family transcriptional regulator